MARCDRPDCGRGDIDYQGYCTCCSRRPLTASAPGAVSGHATAGGIAGGSAVLPGVGRVRQEPWWGLELVAAGSPLPPDYPGPGDPATGDDSPVPEERRFCRACGQPVGRGNAGRPGRVKGFCPRDRTPFDFARSRAGELVAERYEIRRTLGGGGFGEALLAYDRNLGVNVVLKDLSGTQAVAKTAQQERDALVELRHDSIVRIYGYEPEGPYLVLEYVPGTPLSPRADDRLEVILAHGLQILQALDYLHARRLLHIDVKPPNIIRFPEEGADGPRDRVRLIDFGAVRPLGMQGPLESYTAIYAPPESDPERASPTEGFDLFCLGSTLRELCGPYLMGMSVQPGVPALDRLLNRATDISVPQRRFVSARQFAEQLSGVIRQVVAVSAAAGGRATPPPVGHRVSRPSAIFGSMTGPLHGGLGEPRPLDHWINARATANQGIMLASPFTAPVPVDAAAVLPAPLADPDDPGLTRDCEAQLAACRTAIRDGDPDRADGMLDSTGLPEWAWIRAWYAGLIALARRDAASATVYFEIVRDALAGELIPLVALGICAEIQRYAATARQHYTTVVQAAPAFGAAAFGLARTSLLGGNRAAAVAAAERLATELQSRELRSEHEARIAVVRLLAAVTESSLPAKEDLARAEKLAAALPVREGQQIRLDAEILYARSRITGDWLGLSELIRRLAQFAETRKGFVDMVDLANRLRPPVEWWWRRGFRRTSDDLPAEKI